MRKVNSILAIFILIVFVIHTVLSDILLVGVEFDNIRPQQMVAGFLVVLILIHIIISLILTFQTVYALSKSGASYFKENKLFWTRRISGLAVMLLIGFHLWTFIGFHTFGPGRLVLAILLVLSLAIHIISNVKPLMISLGAGGRGGRAYGLLFVISLVLLAAAVCFVIFGIGWIG